MRHPSGIWIFKSFSSPENTGGVLGWALGLDLLLADTRPSPGLEVITGSATRAASNPNIILVAILNFTQS